MSPSIVKWNIAKATGYEVAPAKDGPQIGPYYRAEAPIERPVPPIRLTHRAACTFGLITGLFALAGRGAERYSMAAVSFLLFFGTWYTFHGRWPVRAERPARAVLAHFVGLVCATLLVWLSIDSDPVRRVLYFYAAGLVGFLVWFDLNRVRG